jgi:cobalt-zinc-cadmium efflux system outer membrane protein
MRCFSTILRPTGTLLFAGLIAACGCHSVGDRAIGEKPVASGAIGSPPAATDTAATISAVQTYEPPIESRAQTAVRTPYVHPAAYQQPDETAMTVPTPEMLDTAGDAASPQRLPTSPLQLSDLENMALSNNPVIARAGAQIRAAQGSWVQTGLPPNPRLGYVAEEMGNAGSAGMQGGFVGQQFITAHKLALNRRIAAWQIQRARQELEAERLRVLTDVRTAYYDVLISQERRELAANLVGISEQAVQSAELLFKFEEVSEADPLRARVEAERARIVWENAEAQLLEAWRRLAAVTGVPDMRLQRLEGDLDPSALNLSWETARQQVLTESPEVAAATANVEAAQWAVRRACAEAVPNVEALAVVTHDAASGDTLTGIEIGVPIPLLDRNQGGIMQAEGRAAAAQRDVDRVVLDLQTRLAEVFQRHDTARTQVQRYSRQGGIIDSAEQTLQLIRAGYEVEEFGVLDLLSAQRSYFEARLAYLDSLRLLWDAVLEIQGLLLQDSLAERTDL